MSEREKWRDSSLIMMFVAYPNTFLVVDLGSSRLKVCMRRDVLFSLRQRQWQTPRWVDFAINDIGDGVAAFVTEVPGVR